MSTDINSQLFSPLAGNRLNQVFNIDLNQGLVNSLQQSINNLTSNLTNNVNQTQSDANPLEENEDNQTADNSGIRLTRSRFYSNNPNRNSLSIQSRPRPLPGGFKRRDYTNSNSASQSRRPTVIIQVPLQERYFAGSTTNLADGTVVESFLNSDGSSSETITSSSGSSITKTYQDYKADQNGFPTGFKTTIVDNNFNVSIYSTIINNLENGTISTVTTDISDPSNPRHVMSSALVKNSNVKDDDGNFLYNSNTTKADGLNETVTHEPLIFDDADSINRTSGYKSIYTSVYPNGSRVENITKTISSTDDTGKRVTIVYNINDPNNPIEMSRTVRSDPFITKKLTGPELTSHLEKINSYGLLDINSDGNLDIETDLLLISRYSKGLRGNDLINNINFTNINLSVNEIEQKISRALTRGLYDVIGSGQELNNEDFLTLAKFMMGARNESLMDQRRADDSSIEIKNNGENILSIHEENPLLNEIQEIFGVSGKLLEFNNSNNVNQYYRLFFVDTSKNNT